MLAILYQLFHREGDLPVEDDDELDGSPRQEGHHVKGIRIRPDERGTRVALFDLEADIMDVVWSRGLGWFAVSEVRDGLLAERDIAYTTVMTTVARLHDKRILRRKREGRRYLYRARFGREELARKMASEVLDSLQGQQGHDAALALLVDRVAVADEAELERLERLIRARRRDLEK